MSNPRGLAIGFIAVLLIIMLAYQFDGDRSPASYEEYGEGDAVFIPPSPATTPPHPLAEIESLQFQKKYSEARELCRRIIEEGPADARAAAMQRMPLILASMFRENLQRGDPGAAREALGEMDAFVLGLGASGTGDEASAPRRQLADMQREWRESQERRMRDALRDRNDTAIETLFAEIAADPQGKLPAREYLEYLMGRWSDDRKAGRADAADRALRQAAQIAAGEFPREESWGIQRCVVEERMRTELPGDQLLREGERLLVAGDYPLACCYLIAYREPENDKPLRKDEVKQRLLERLQRRMLAWRALIGLAGEALKGSYRWLPPDLHENRIEIILDTVRNSAREIDRFDPRPAEPSEKYALAASAWEMLFKLWQGKLERWIALGEFDRVESLFEQVLQSSSDYRFQFGWRYLKRDPWIGVPAAIRSSIESKFAQPDQRLGELAAAIRREDFAADFPGRQQFMDTYLSGLASKGIAELDGNPSLAYRTLRNVFRRAPESSAANQARSAMIRALRNARDAKDYKKLYDHAVFFMGELGPGGAGPEIRDELAASINMLVDQNRDRPMQHVFMLSLLADALAGDPRGIQAAEQVIAKGMEVVAKLPEREEPSPPSQPSPLPGHTVIALDNATEHHLLAFFDGPERFYVRLGPLRRGSLVLKDGPYVVAALVTAEQVIPSKQSTDFRSQFQLRKYAIIISRGGKEERANQYAMAHGTYQLLRAPAAAGPLAVDPASGFVLQKAPDRP